MALTKESQLELETGPSESSPLSQSESAALLLPDSTALTSEIFMTDIQLLIHGYPITYPSIPTAIIAWWSLELSRLAAVDFQFHSES